MKAWMRYGAVSLACVIVLAACDGGASGAADAVDTTNRASANAPAATAAKPATAASPTSAAAPAAAVSFAEELALANRAFAEGRLVAPAGDNALEHFLAARALDPGNVAAEEALVELFPVAVGAVESNLAAGRHDEATRVLALIERAAPGSPTQRSLAERVAAAVARDARGEVGALAPRSSDIASRPAATDAASTAMTPNVAPGAVSASTSSPSPVTRETTPPIERQVDQSVAVEATTPTEREGASAVGTLTSPIAIASTTESLPEPPAPAAADSAATPNPQTTDSPRTQSTESDPIVRQRYPVEYPPEARQRRLEGWVQVEFIVGTDGRARNPVVVSAEPMRIFDRAAMRAVQRWRFEPGTRDGAPVEKRTRARLDFSLG